MEAHPAVECGVVELQDGGMEAQPTTSLPIEGVADDGGIESVGVGAMDAQLVGAPRQGYQAQQGGTAAVVKCPDLQHLI